MNPIYLITNPVFYILLIYIVGIILLVNSNKNIILEIISFFSFYLVLSIYYYKISDNYFADYISYLDWVQNADYFIKTHIDILFSYMMLFLNHFENIFSFKIFVLLSILIYLIVLKFELPLNVSIFSALLVSNPRSLEFLFNSTRSSLCTLLLSIFFIYMYKKQRLLSLVIAILSFGTHLFISSFYFFINFLSPFINLKILFLLLFVTSIFFLFAINFSSNITFLNDLLIYLINTFKFGNFDEYLSNSITTDLTGRLSIIFFIIQPVLFSIYLSYKTSIYSYFQKISVLSLCFSLLLIFIFPVVIRFAFLSLIISFIIISSNIKINNPIHLIFLLYLLIPGIYLVLNNAEFN